MTEVLLHSSSSSSSSSCSSPSSLSCAPSSSPPPHHHHHHHHHRLLPDNADVNNCDPQQQQQQQLSLLALLLALFRKSFWVACKAPERRDLFGGGMEIGSPTDVRHVAHVTFDRFNGFLGLPVEFEPHVSRRAPSASATVFGVSTESMQVSFDCRGNSVPTILLLLQKHLYAQGGLLAEGIFRITAGNSQEEYVRDQLNRGVVPEGVDVHCLAGLIKAWFRELPTGVLDSLSAEQVMQCETEEDCVHLVRSLPSTEASLLDWAVNLMADVVQQEHVNKMNARNIAMVFAPNMTQMADPLTALMYAVQVMNFLKTLILRTLRLRGDSSIASTPVQRLEPFDENDQLKCSLSFFECPEEHSDTKDQAAFSKPVMDSSCSYSPSDDVVDDQEMFSLMGEKQNGQASNSGVGEHIEMKNTHQDVVCDVALTEKVQGISNLSRVESQKERIEAWR